MRLRDSSQTDAVKPANASSKRLLFVYARFSAPVLICLGALGCSSAPPEFVQPKGKVTFDGKDVAYGTVEFIPDAEKGHQGPSGNADIVDGTYEIEEAGGKSLAKGPYVARVTIFTDKVPSRPGAGSAATTDTVAIAVGFPVKVNVNSSTVDIAVPASANGFDMYKPGGLTDGAR